MFTGEWFSPKHNSWWSEEPMVEPQGVRWPAHSFTGSLLRGRETAGFWEQETSLACFQVSAPCSSQRTTMCQEVSHRYISFDTWGKQQKQQKKKKKGLKMLGALWVNNFNKLSWERNTSGPTGLKRVHFKQLKLDIYVLRHIHIFWSATLPAMTLRFELVTMFMMRVPGDALKSLFCIRGENLMRPGILSHKTVLSS